MICSKRTKNNRSACAESFIEVIDCQGEAKTIFLDGDSLAEKLLQAYKAIQNLKEGDAMILRAVFQGEYYEPNGWTLDGRYSFRNERKGVTYIVGQEIRK